LENSNRLLVLVLMDESGSLGGYGGPATDPLNQRVDGIRAALTGLARLAATPIDGRHISVQALMTGFSTSVDGNPATGSWNWEPLSEGSLPSLLSQAGAYAARNTGRDTDFGSALLTARALLAQRAAEMTRTGGSEPCKALIWFTDGQYSIEDRTDPAAASLPKTLSYAPGVRLDQPGGGNEAVQAGVRFLCRAEGLMDGIESDGVVKFTVGLSVQMTQAASDFLGAATTGSAGGTTCGSRLSPAIGEYLDVKDASQLFFAFANLLGGPVAPPRPGTICPVQPCTRGSSGFVTVPYLHGFLIEATTGTDGIVIVLRAPDGSRIKLSPGAPATQELAGTTIRQTWVSGRAAEVEGQFSPSSSRWVGDWSYYFVDPAGPSSAAVPLSSVELFADLKPELAGRTSVLLGAPTPITLELTDSQGQVVATGPLASAASLAASVTDPTLAVTSALHMRHSPDELYHATLSLPPSSEAGQVQLDTTLHFANPGLAPIAPVTRSFLLPTRLPAAEGYPSIAPLELQLPSISGTGTTHGTLTVSASPDAAGCVWIRAPSISLPGPSGSIAYGSEPTANSPSNCLHVAAGQSRQLVITFRSQRSVTGSAHAVLPVVLESGITRGARTIQIPVGFDLYPAPNVAKRWAIIVGLTLLGLSLPLLVLWLLNYASGRITPPQRLLALTQPVRSPASDDLARIDGQPLQWEYERFDLMEKGGSPRPRRRLRVGDFEVRAIPARRLADLFRGPFAVATSADTEILTGPARSSSRAIRPQEQEVPLALVGTWLFRPSSLRYDNEQARRPTVEGQLTMVIADGDEDFRHGKHLLEDAGATLAEHSWRARRERSDGRLLHRLASYLQRLRRADESNEPTDGHERVKVPTGGATNPDDPNEY
jgi:hypothetical protein